MIGLLLLGCPTDPKVGTSGAPDDSSADRTGDTGADPLGPPCEAGEPCSATLAAAVWSDGPIGGFAGYDLTAGTIDDQPVVLVGAPLGPWTPPEYPIVAALVPSDLSWLGSFEDDDPDGSAFSSHFGESIAIAPDGARFAVGASDGAESNLQAGVVFGLDRLPRGFEQMDPVLKIHGDLHFMASFGTKVLYLDLAGTGPELVAGAGNAQPGYSSGVYCFDPALTGEHGLEVATASLTGQHGLGQQMAGWDADGDGLDELVTSIVGPAVAHFSTPWVGTLTEADADVLWTDPDPGNQLNSTIEALGDLDGDGQEDLALGAPTLWGPQERSGALYIVPAGLLTSSLASELPYPFLGAELGEGVGSSATSGDYDGDGNTDLVVGAYGVVPGRQTGKVLGYLGPLVPGIRTPADADFVVNGEYFHDWFGADVVTVDADGDARSDLVVGAQGWPGSAGIGKVYLLLGGDLLP